MGLLTITTADAKQVTITPVRGSVWFVNVDNLGYLLLRNDSIVAYDKQHQEQGKDALANTHRIAVEETRTALPLVRPTRTGTHTMDIIGRPTTSLHQGIYIIQQGTDVKKVMIR